MKVEPRTPRARSSVYDELASKLVQVVHDTHHNELTGVESFTVVHLSPFTIEHLGGALVLEEGDPDFTIGKGVRALLTGASVALGDQVWCLRERQIWHAVDVTDGG